MGRPALLFVGEPLLRMSAGGSERTLSVTAYAVPPPPKGGGLLQLTDKCIKAPPLGGAGEHSEPERVPPDSGPSRENAAPGGPQTFRYHKIKIILLRFSTKISEDVEKPIGGCIFLRKNVVK